MFLFNPWPIDVGLHMPDETVLAFESCVTLRPIAHEIDFRRVTVGVLFKSGGVAGLVLTARPQTRQDLSRVVQKLVSVSLVCILEVLVAALNRTLDPRAGQVDGIDVNLQRLLGFAADSTSLDSADERPLIRMFGQMCIDFCLGVCLEITSRIRALILEFIGVV